MHLHRGFLALVPCTLFVIVACTTDASDGDDDTSSSSSSSSGAATSSSSSSSGSTSSSGSSSGGKSSSSSGGSSSGGSSGGPSAPAHGTIHGAAFTPGSALVHGSETGVDLVFGSRPDVCQDATDLASYKHSVLVQLYDLQRLDNGSWKSGGVDGTADVKYAVLGSNCSDDDADQYAEDATEYSVDIVDPLADPVTGTVDITFADGSTFAGTFSVPACDTTQSEGATCEE